MFREHVHSMNRYGSKILVLFSSKNRNCKLPSFHIYIHIYIYIYIYILFIYSCNSNNNHTTRSYNLLTLTLIQINFCRITPLHLFQDYDQHKPRVFTALDTIINQHIRSNMSSTMFLMLTHSDTTNPHTPYQTIF